MMNLIDISFIHCNIFNVFFFVKEASTVVHDLTKALQGITGDNGHSLQELLVHVVVSCENGPTQTTRQRRSSL